MKKLLLISTLLIGAITNGQAQHISDSSTKKSIAVKKTDIKKALYIIDGVKQINPGSIAEGLHPDSIAEMTVLKNEDAIKLFGIEAANGAIVITTRSKKDQIAKLIQEQKDSLLPKGKGINNGVNFKTYNTTSEKGIAITSLNDKPNITLRGLGNRSLPNYNDAVYILDGEKVDKDDVNLVNPNTIQSISILKKDSAITQYGPQAYNGVVIITTKPVKKPDNPDKPVDKN